MARPEIAEAAAGAVWATFIVQPDEVFSPQNADEIAEAVLAVVEPMIRQDERAQCGVLIEKIESEPQSVRVSEVLDLIAKIRDGYEQQYAAIRQARRVVHAFAERVESEINQLAGKAET